ncbi:MAG: sigma-54-dependent Fis family transcriptional regulator [Alphaproteobacteria bacterium]|nr:sigma-54-dependent Fis family transcriptional regulator [Alphaproteobacteria bacterium]
MNTTNAKILIIDDDAEVRSLISGVLSDEGYQTYLAANEQEAISSAKSNMPDLAFLDLWIKDDESAGFKILDKLKNINSELPVVIISGHGTIDIAMNALRKGAFDFLEKPFVIDRLLLTCTRTLEFHKLKTENNSLKNDRLCSDIFSVCTSIFANSIKSTIDKIANSNSRVFIKSPVGIGVDSIAYRIHKHSSRKDCNFVTVNCMASSYSKSFDDELFGTDKSYGYLEKAAGGTIFLEDIDKLSVDSQRKLLMFLQSGKLQLTSRNIYSDVRIICSTTDNESSKMNEFSPELFYRLKISEINIPSLTERREDIIPIINWYMSRSEELFNLKPKQFSEKALAILQAYDWPGNIHQIKNIVESSLINSSDSNSSQIDETMLPNELTVNTKDKFESLNIAKFITLPLKEAKECFESDYLKAQVNRFSGNISQTANFIGMERSALHRKLKALDVQYMKNPRHHKSEK